MIFVLRVCNKYICFFNVDFILGVRDEDGFFFFLYDGHTSKLSAGIYELVPVYNELIA